MMQAVPVSLFVLVISSRQYSEREIYLYNHMKASTSKGFLFFSFVNFPCNGEQSPKEGNLRFRCAPLLLLQLQWETKRIVDTLFHGKYPALWRSDLFPVSFLYHLWAVTERSRHHAVRRRKLSFPACSFYAPSFVNINLGDTLTDDCGRVSSKIDTIENKSLLSRVFTLWKVKENY